MNETIDDATGTAEPRLIVEQGAAARVAGDRRTGARRPRLPAGAGADFRACGLHRSDHGGAAGRHHDDRGLRGRLARALAGARRRRPDRARLPAGDFLARHRPAAGAALGFRALCRQRGQGRDGGRGRRPPAVPRPAPGRRGRRRAAARGTMPRRASRPRCCFRSTTWRTPRSCSATTSSRKRCGAARRRNARRAQKTDDRREDATTERETNTARQASRDLHPIQPAAAGRHPIQEGD